MNEFSRFYVELFRFIWDDIKVFFSEGIWKGILVRIGENFKSYYDLLMAEMSDFTPVSWVMVAVAAVLNVALVIFIIAKLVIWFQKYAAFRKVEIEKNELIEEIALLNDKVIALIEEKNQIMALKVSQLGINASTGEPADKIITGPIQRGQRMQPAYAAADGQMPSGVPVRGDGEPRKPGDTSQGPVGPSRFVKLIQVDKEYAGKDTHVYMEEKDFLTLPELVDAFVNFASSKMKLYYTRKMISLFFAGMAASKVMILEGISGTGKTSLPYAM
ncbi:MAG: hypothetical protein WC251_03060, partial [Candidatus Izemoplasmatales bacterium]